MPATKDFGSDPGGVVVEEGRSRSPDGGVPWASALDPAANLRVLADIQRRGLQAASEVAERLVTVVDGNGDGSTGRAPSVDGQPIGDLDGLVDLWGELMKRSLRAMVRLPTAAAAASAPPNGAPAAEAADTPPTVDVGTSSVSAPLRLRTGAPGETPAEAEIWLHNGTTEEHRELHIHCGELRSPEGESLPARPRFDPEVVTLPPRSSRGVLVTVELFDEWAAPGPYRGMVLVSGLPGAWLPIEVVVGP